MLDYLHIRNLALIEDMELEFAPGMNVLTGETGAGKSFILKALGFVLGDRLGADAVRPGADRARVEALFTLDGEEILLRRELLAGGRSRIHVNDSLRSRESVLALRDRLLIHTSQHEQQRLLQPAFQAKIVDDAMPCHDLVTERDALLCHIRAVAEDLRQVRERRADLADRRDLLEMRQQEIDKVGPEEGEEERLEELRARAREAETLRKRYDAALALLHGSEDGGLLDALSRFSQLLHEMGAADASLEEDADALGGMREQLLRLSSRLRRPPALDEPVDMDAVEARLYEFAQLKRRLRRTMPEILALRTEIAENLSFLDACELDLSALEKTQAGLAGRLAEVTAEIAPHRHAAAETLVSRLEEELRGLGFPPEIRVLPEFAPFEIWPGVADERTRLLWAPNPGQPPQPLDRIASGGELSRFLLALIAIQPHAEGATCIFDEVDAGVGGLTLHKLGDKLEAFSGRHQTLLITHWPQLASRGSRHFRVEKMVRDGQTYTLCSALDDAGRKAELDRMAGIASQEGR